MPYQAYAVPSAKKATTGIFAMGEPKNQDPFTRVIAAKAAPTAFQVMPYTNLSNNTGSASAALQGYTTAGPALASQAGSLLPIQAPAATTAADGGGTTASSGSSGNGGFSPYDPTTDPIYQRIVQLGKQQVSQAVAGGDALRKQILIALGDPTFAAKQQFGDPNAPVYGDASTTQAAEANPYSTLAGIKHTYVNNNASIDQTDNKAGGYYSSTHANQLADENRNYNQAITDADSGAATQLSNIVQQILQTQNTAQSANISALDSATQNLINAAIQNGYAFLGYNADGTPKFGAPAAAAAGGTGGGSGAGATGGGATGTQTPTQGGGLGGSMAAPYASNIPGSVLDNARRQTGKGVYFTG